MKKISVILMFILSMITYSNNKIELNTLSVLIPENWNRMNNMIVFDNDIEESIGFKLENSVVLSIIVKDGVEDTLSDYREKEKEKSFFELVNLKEERMIFENRLAIKSLYTVSDKLKFQILSIKSGKKVIEITFYAPKKTFDSKIIEVNQIINKIRLK